MQNCAKRPTIKSLLPALLLASSTSAFAAKEELPDNRTPLVLDFTTATSPVKMASWLPVCTAC